MRGVSSSGRVGSGALVFLVLAAAAIVWVAVSERSETPTPTQPVSTPAAEAPQAPRASPQRPGLPPEPAFAGGTGTATSGNETSVEYRAALGQLSRLFGVPQDQVAERLTVVHDLVEKETGADLAVLDMGQVLAAASDAIATTAGSLPAVLERLHQRLPGLFPPPSANSFDDLTSAFARLVVQKIKDNPAQTAAWAANEVGQELVALCWNYT